MRVAVDDVQDPETTFHACVVTRLSLRLEDKTLPRWQAEDCNIFLFCELIKRISLLFKEGVAVIIKK